MSDLEGQISRRTCSLNEMEERIKYLEQIIEDCVTAKNKSSINKFGSVTSSGTRNKFGSVTSSGSGTRDKFGSVTKPGVRI